MALTPLSGFSISTSGPNDVATEIPNTQSDVLNNMPFITDTNLNKYAIDPGAYPKTTEMMAGFMKGKRVLVTYYRLLRQGGNNNRNNIADYPTTRNVLNTEYQKILNLEITLPRGFDFESDPSRASVGVTGEAFFYPNMNPNVGDIFMMGVGDGRIGVFQVSNIAINSWRTDRVYMVKFVLQSFLEVSDSDPIEGAVTQISVFSKENYLGGTAALLSEQTYLQLEKIKALRAVLLKHYHHLFFDKELYSYLRPDGVYDPFAVYFMANKITMEDLHIRPKILTGIDHEAHADMVWARLEDRYNTTLYGISPGCGIVRYNRDRMSVFVTELAGKSVIIPSDSTDVEEAYVFTPAFYENNTTEMTTWDLRIYTAITQRSCGDLSSLISEYLDTVFALTDDDKYYRIPLYIHLIDMALQSQYREIDAPSMNYASS